MSCLIITDRMTAKKSICRLCLKKDDRCVRMNIMSKEVLTVLQIKMNLDVSKDPTMCENCSDIVNRSLFFKSALIDTEEIILSFNAKDKQTVLDLREVYSYNKPKTILYKAYDICRLCMTKQTQKENCVSIYTLMNKTVVENMMERYMSDTNFNITRNPVVCFHCRDNMNCYFKLIQDCADTEEKINAYIQNQRIGKGQQVALDDVLRDLFKGVLELPDTYAQLLAIKQEEIKIEECPDEINDEMVEIKEEIEIKVEEVDANENNCAFQAKSEDMSEMRLGGCAKSVFMACSAVKQEIKESDDMEDKYKQFDGNMESPSHFRNQIEAKHKENGNTDRSKSNLPKNAHEPMQIRYENDKRHGCRKKIITYQTRRRQDISYECNNCEFKTKYLPSIRDHNISHHKAIADVNSYKCAICQYESKFKKTLKKHIIRHLNRRINGKPEGTKSFDKRKNIEPLKVSHQNLLHCRKKIATFRDHPSETSFECNKCDYNTDRMWQLWYHHRSRHSAESQKFICAICGYKTNFKFALRVHILRHLEKKPQLAESKSETKMKETETPPSNHAKDSSKRLKSKKGNLLNQVK